MATEAEDLADACRLLVLQRQNELIIAASNITSSLDIIEDAFGNFKKAVLRHREYEALAKKVSDNL